MDLKTLDILTADVDNKRNVRTEAVRCGEVCNGLDNAVVESECTAYHVLAVAGYG